MLVLLLLSAPVSAEGPCGPSYSEMEGLLETIEDSLSGIQITPEIDLGFGVQLPAIETDVELPSAEALNPLIFSGTPQDPGTGPDDHPGNQALYDGAVRFTEGVEGVSLADGLYLDMSVPRWAFQLNHDQMGQAVESLAAMGGERGTEYGLESYFNARSGQGESWFQDWLIGGEHQTANIGTVEVGGSVVNVDNDGQPTNVLWRMGIWADGVEIDPDAFLNPDGTFNADAFPPDTTFQINFYGEEVRTSSGKWSWFGWGERANDGPRPGMDKPVGEPFRWDRDSDGSPLW